MFSFSVIILYLKVNSFLRNLLSRGCLVLFQDDPSLSEYALDGLRQVMAVKSRVVLPFLVPQVSALLQENHSQL